MKKKGAGGYDPVVELAKGAKLEAAAYDKTQKATVIATRSQSAASPKNSGDSIFNSSAVAVVIRKMSFLGIL